MQNIVKILLLCIFIFSSLTGKAITDLPTDSKLVNLLDYLFETNEKFSNSHKDDFFANFKQKQTPSITMLSCSDSRVHMLAFHENPKNEVFTIDNIGNQITTSEGSIDYGVEILQTPFLLILGHSDCGAVHASITDTKTNIPAIDKELSTIGLSSKKINNAVIENIHNQVNKALEKYKSKIKSETLTVIGILYDFKNDYGLGNGKLILVNINGHTNPEELAIMYKNKIKHLRLLKP